METVDATSRSSNAMTGRFRVALRDVAQRFGRRTVFSELNAEVESGRALVIAGPNGSGKSTLLRIIAGLLVPSRGRVEVFAGESALDRAALRQAIGYGAPDPALYG